MKNTTRLTFCLLLTCAVLLARPCAATPGEWSLTGSLNVARESQTATKLLDGRVLIVGGSLGLADCEIYDPATGTWNLTGSLNQGRYFHTATLLLSGKVLVAGGYAVGSDPILTAELYDPATGVWTATGSPGRQRYQHAATLLADGRVMIVGGFKPGNVLDTTQLYDPTTETWSQTGKLNIPRDFHTATLLNDGKVLVAGGESTPSDPNGTEVWDPATGVWSLVGALINGRKFHTATLLPSGKVLVAGGYLANGVEIVYNECEIFDPATGTWSETGELSTGRYSFTATLLPDGKVLAAGGIGENLTNLGSAELYDPASGSWSPTGSMNFARSNHAAALLNSGMVLVEGGYATDTSSAELYDPGTMTDATAASGRGSINGQGDSATFNFRANLNGDRPSGSVTFSDPAAGISISKAKVRTLTFTGNSAELGGNARLGDGTRVTYSVSVSDNGDGSTDTFNISLSNGYSAGGTLTSGDISIQ